MIIHAVEQGTEEWFDLKRGKFSASRIYLLMGKKGEGYHNYLNEIAYERVTGKSVEMYMSEDMMIGTEREPEAREDYKFDTGFGVEQVGFVELDEFTGVSPDGLVNEKGLLEIKCPKLTTLVSQHISGKEPKKYYWQIQMQMWVCEREWCDYYVYHPEFKAFKKRIERNEDDIKALQEEVKKAVESVNEKIKILEKLWTKIL